MKRSTKLLGTSKFTYDSMGRVLTSSAYWFYDTSGGVRNVLGSGWVTTTRNYLDAQNAVEMTDPTGRLTRAVYDALGRIADLVYPDGTTHQRFAYTDNGNTRTITTSPAPVPGNALVVREEYTPFGALAKVRKALGQESAVTFDALGRPETLSDRTAQSKLIYGVFGEVEKVQRFVAAGVYTDYLSLVRNRLGAPTTIQDGTGAKWLRSYDALNRLSAEKQPTSETISYAYWAGSGKVRRMTHPDGDTQSITYDGFGLPKQIVGGYTAAPAGWTDPSVTFVRNLAGLTSAASTNRTDTPSDDVTLSFLLDSLGQIRETSSSLLGGAANVFMRDAAGRITSMTVAGQSIGRHYDSVGRLDQTLLGGSVLTTYGYSGFGPSTSATHRNTLVTSTTYDAELRPRVHNTTKAGTSLFKEEYIWGQGGTLARIDKMRQGVAGKHTDLYLTDSRERTVGAAYAVPGVAAFAAASGNVTSTMISSTLAGVAVGHKEKFSYDAADAFSQKVSFGTTITPVTGADHRYTSFGGTVLSDKLGRTTSTPGPASYAWDGLGRLVQITASGSTTEFSYDAFGRVAQWSTGAGLTAGKLDYGIGTVLREQSGGVDRVFVPGLGLTPEAVVQGATVYTNHALVGDRLGWVTSSAGALVERVDYTAYGQPSIFTAAGAQKTESTVGNRLLLTGQPYFGALRLHRMLYRFYRPDWGAFLNRDVLGIANGPNAYLYAQAQPIELMDPRGLAAESPLDGLMNLDMGRWAGESAGAFAARIATDQTGPGSLAMNADRGVMKVGALGAAGGVILALSGGLGTGAVTWSGAAEGGAAAFLIESSASGAAAGVGFRGLDDVVEGTTSSLGTYAWSAGLGSVWSLWLGAAAKWLGVAAGGSGRPLRGAVTEAEVAGPRIAATKFQSVAAEGAPNIVYRGLAQGEAAVAETAGLNARAPGLPTEIASHIAGARQSQWISTMRSLDIARSQFGQYGVVEVNLSKVSSPVVDLTRGIPGMPSHYMLSRWSVKMQEVLVQDAIPASAIRLLP